jgi:hypothetical protein
VEKATKLFGAKFIPECNKLVCFTFKNIFNPCLIFTGKAGTEWSTLSQLLCLTRKRKTRVEIFDSLKDTSFFRQILNYVRDYLYILGPVLVEDKKIEIESWFPRKRATRILELASILQVSMFLNIFFFVTDAAAACKKLECLFNKVF